MDVTSLELDDMELRLDGTRFTFLVDGVRHVASLPSIGEPGVLDALQEIELRLAAGESVAAAIAAAEARPPQGRHMTVAGIRGLTILDDTHGATKDDVGAALRSLVQLTPAGARSVAVLGEFSSEPADYVEEHDAIGRLIVRLNVGKLVAVGHGARHLASAAGLEGSWDGESVIVGTPEEAYDLLRDELRANDVVLVKGARSAGLSPLVDRLIGDAS